MKNKVVIITGVSRGIGRATTKLLLNNGYNIVGSYLESDDLIESLIDELEYYKKNISFVRGDLRHESTIQQLIQTAVDNFGSIDCLVNNAGIFDRLYIEEIDYYNYLSYIELMQISPFLLIKACLPYFRKNEYGKIVNISSSLALTGYKYSSHYVSAKAGLIGLSKSLAIELAPHINVNCIVPGFIETTNIKKDSAERRKERISKIPKQRIGYPEDVANAVLFLLSPNSDYITGSIINVSGGLHI